MPNIITTRTRSQKMIKSILIALFIAATLLPADAEARRRRSYKGATVSVQINTKIDARCQAIAKRRAAAMARMGILSHSIHTYHGANCPSWAGHGATGEGIGYGGNEKCETCIAGSVCVGDASVRSKGGTWYRVRLWR